MTEKFVKRPLVRSLYNRLDQVAEVFYSMISDDLEARIKGFLIYDNLY